MRRSHSAPLHAQEGGYTGGGGGSSPYRRHRYGGHHGSWSAARSGYGGGAASGLNGTPTYYAAPQGGYVGAGYDGAGYGVSPGTYFSLYTGPHGLSHGVPSASTGLAFGVPDPGQYVAGQLSSPLVGSYIRAQVEWYMSTENLVRDVFLRKRMDKLGWVGCEVVAGFRRVQGWLDHLRIIVGGEEGREWAARQVAAAVAESAVVEVEGGRLRKREGWETWLLPDVVGEQKGEDVVASVKEVDVEAGAKAHSVDALVVEAQSGTVGVNSVGVVDAIVEIANGPGQDASSGTEETAMVSVDTNGGLISVDQAEVTKTSSSHSTPSEITVVTVPENAVVSAEAVSAPSIPDIAEDAAATGRDDEERSSNQTVETSEDGAADDAGEPTLVGDNGSTASVQANDGGDSSSAQGDIASVVTEGKVAWADLMDDAVLPNGAAPGVASLAMAPAIAADSIKKSPTVSTEVVVGSAWDGKTKNAAVSTAQVDTSEKKSTTLGTNGRPSDQAPSSTNGEPDEWVTVTSGRKTKKPSVGGGHDFSRWGGEGRQKKGVNGAAGGSGGDAQKRGVAANGEKVAWKKQGHKTVGVEGTSGRM
ncbi:hypothetical protein M427DRAFT_454214 [Gonapodya prolifera JEL478]|uniref:HTH La-type RNA-binding domain-containing protein n=1 Tax=Gonapodya prolifera (strain JEL478) TaxID=1344416 RepID=A0A139ASY1_GONPJ|nr:hypothetical protein M427DRAFT_454214 [Gonapodya prolifera JEL478]|eukprot:KXS19605.1 hypothetical protein M427DRAFT_454214 [Gonapodya prolifera JEL478]